MPVASDPATPAEDDLEFAADQAIEACGSDGREAVQAMLVAHQFLEHEFDELRAKVSTDYARGRLAPARDSKN